MKNYTKYKKSYFIPPENCMDWATKDSVTAPPIWCSVDLRDGNQALIEPMNLKQKLDFFKLLVKIGFKEIEIGFPASNDTEFNFARALIDNNLIPDDVTIQVLTQAREHIINKTFEAVKGAKNVIIHLYNATSVAHREQVFNKNKDEIKKIAVNGAKLLKKLAEEDGSNYRFEYSPEGFTSTEMDYSLQVINAVLDVFKPTKENKVIINMPSTVENAYPHIFAQQVEFIKKNINFSDSVILSLHTHNDMGGAVASAELGLLAGAERVEGTLFGNGERTGNLDIVTLALNLYSQGVDPKLDFSDLPNICETFKNCTNMDIYPRQPYAGSLVFAAFSGSHQDAIAKAMKIRESSNSKDWSVPYLLIDPSDIGREYMNDVIRINSQSGKGGVCYILQQDFGIDLPKQMRENMGYVAKKISDKLNKELKPDEVYGAFVKNYVNNQKYFTLKESHFKQENGIEATITVNLGKKLITQTAGGNGRLDAVSNAIKKCFNIEYTISCYEQHALSKGSTSKAISYVGIDTDTGSFWGAGIKDDIISSSIDALVSAINNYLKK